MSPKELRSRLASNIERLRKKEGWSLTRLAEFAGLSPATVSWAASRKTAVTIDTIAKLCHALEVEPGVLLGPPKS